MSAVEGRASAPSTAASDSVKPPVPAPPKNPNATQPITIPDAVAEGSTRAKRRRTRRRRGRLPDRAVVFVGPMAAGKTSLGRKVAKDLGIPFVDTDAVFVRQHGAITEFFATRGEPEFRRIEEQIIAEELAQPGARIVALGGGAVISERTRALLHQYPVVLLMTTQAAVLRTANLSRRPLLRDDPDAWGRILESRREFYNEVSDVTYRTDRASKEQLARRVAGWMRTQARKYRGIERVQPGGNPPRADAPSAPTRTTHSSATTRSARSRSAERTEERDTE